MSKIPLSLDEDFERKLQDIKRNNSYDYIKITGIQPKQLDFVGYIKDFYQSANVADSSIDGTSNSTAKDIVGLEKDINKPIFKMVAFNKIYIKLKEKYGEIVADSWLESEILGKSYLHDAHSSTFIPYCYAYDLTKLAKEGLFYLNREDLVPYNNKPAEHLDTFVNHVKEFVSFCCNRQAGAVGMPNLLPWMYYFWVKDIKENYNGCKYIKGQNGENLTGIEHYPNAYRTDNQNIKYFKQCTQSLIYALNQPYLRDSIQSAFTNVSIFDHEYAHALFDGMEFPDGTLAFDCIDNIVNLQKLFMEVVADIREESMFTFPVLTMSLLIDKETKKFVDEDFARWASNHNCRWNDSNFYISETVDALSNCCRLSSSIKDMMNDEGYFNSIGGTALSVGSIKVNTINLANIAYSTIVSNKSTTNSEYSTDVIQNYFKNAEQLYLEKLENQVILNLECLDVIRDIIKANKYKRNLLPNIADGLINLKHMYNTIGIIGIYETLKTFQNKLENFENVLNSDFTKYYYIKVDDFGNTFYTKNAEKFTKNIFDTIHNTINKFKKEHKLDYSINCEQIPAETAASKLMKKDELSYQDLVIKDLPLYGNQFIPLGIKTTLEERVRIAALFDSYLNGGSICHINVESPMKPDMAWEKLNWIAEQGLTYSAFTTKISACKHNHAFFGNVCPKCGENAVTQYARTVGFYTSTGITPEGKETNAGSWSTPRKEEFKLREWEQIAE